MGWRELIESVGGLVLSEPATESGLRAAGDALGAPLPAELAGLLLENNGVRGAYDVDLVWPLDRMVEDNLALRADPELADLYMPFDPLLFFGDAGNGDQFAVVVRGGRPDVFVWDHENDSRTWVAPDLATYLTWWQDGTISR